MLLKCSKTAGFQFYEQFFLFLRKTHYECVLGQNEKAAGRNINKKERIVWKLEQNMYYSISYFVFRRKKKKEERQKKE